MTAVVQTAPAALELRGLVKTFGHTEVLKGIDLRVAEGEFCVLLGPSGCGKSTALRCVAGLESASGGEIFIAGKNVAGKEPKERNIAMVFQSYALYPHMNVQQNMEFPLKMAGLGADERAKKVREAAEFLHIGDLLGRKPAQLSGGQRQRVAIGRAIVREPKLFLFDEPLSNLDAKLRNEMRLEIARLHRRLGVAMLYVTHDQVEAITLADKIVVLNKGHIEQIGTPAEVYNRPASRFVAAFVGTPAMNFIHGSIAANAPAEFSACDGKFRLTVETAARGPAELGVRPEHCRLLPHGNGAGSEAAVSGRIELIENLGPDRYAHVQLGVGSNGANVAGTNAPANGNANGEAVPEFVVRLAPEVAMREGDAVDLAIDRAQVHLFVDGRRVPVSGETA